jgi:hypothetical protein
LVVKVFLRRYDAGLYFSQTKGWTRTLSEALDFKEVDSAKNFGRELGVSHLDVAVANHSGQIGFGTKVEQELRKEDERAGGGTEAVVKQSSAA